MGLALLASFSLFACQRDAVGDLDAPFTRGADGKLTFTATIDDGQATRTSLSNSKVVWNTNEEINIFYGSAGSLFTSTNDSPSTSVSFEGNLSAFTGSTEGGVPLSFWSVYPYHPDNTCSETAVSAYLPDEQFGIRDNIPDKTMMMVARTPGLSLSFKQVCATLRVVINRSDINKVVIRGNQGEVLAGRVSVSMDAGGNPVWSPIENEGSTEITLRIPEGNSSSSRYYYLCLLPQSFANGITVTYYTPTLKGEYVSSARTFERNETYAIGSAQVTSWVDRPIPNNISISPSAWICEVGESGLLKVDVSGPKDCGFDPSLIFNTIDLTLFEKQEETWTEHGNTWSNTYKLKALATSNYPITFFYGSLSEVDFNDLENTTYAYAQIPVDVIEHGEEIDFADPVTEAICLANYDRNGDGVLTVNEAAAVTTLLVNGVSPFNRPDDSSPKITSFDELQYFTGLTEIPEKAFYRQFSLNSIILPGQITAIGTQAFAYSGISTIEIPSGVETIGSSAFSLCNSLGQITIPASVQVIEGRVFFNCPLASVTFDEGSNLNTIGDLAFAYVYRTSSIVIPESVTSFGIGVFKNASVSHVGLPSSLTVIPQDTFYEAKVDEIVHARWNQITEIGENAFRSELGRGRMIPRALPTGLKIIGNNAFQNAVLPEGFTLPSGVTKIGDNAFKNTNLTTIELPSNLSSIGYGAFSNCPLEKVIVRRTTPATISKLGIGVLTETFGTLPALNGIILVPFDKEATFKSSWATWANYIQNNYSSIPGGGNIGDGDFGDGGDA